MEIVLVLDGPVTIILDVDPRGLAGSWSTTA